MGTELFTGQMEENCAQMFMSSSCVDIVIITEVLFAITASFRFWAKIRQCGFNNRSFNMVKTSAPPYKRIRHVYVYNHIQ